MTEQLGNALVEVFAGGLNFRSAVLRWRSEKPQGNQIKISTDCSVQFARPYSYNYMLYGNNRDHKIPSWTLFQAKIIYKDDLF